MGTKSHVCRWGTSLAVRIPKSVAEQWGVKEGSAIEIVHDILSVCDNGGCNKTAIMYRSNLSYAQLRRYLSLLSTQQLIDKNDVGHFQVTPRGRKTMSQMASVMRSLQV